MTIIDDVLAQATGAHFFRSDLHIHSFGASHDVRDTAMTGAAIVATAEREGLAIISITDHNEIRATEAALHAAKSAAVHVVPGVELSTPEGHLLCYLPSLEALRRFHAQLSIVDPGLATSRCQQSLLDCLNLPAPLGGFGVMAHWRAFDVFPAFGP